MFEIIIKQKVGKLSIERGLDGFIRDLAEERIELLNIDEKHLMQYDTVPLFDEHRNPFDRLILATAIAEGLPIISSDHKFSLYANLVDVIW